ncbi:UNKNOWN [Stylonychia lemnae]|uniref:Uncharacterized protein n=1 Tax=Stylonychia lemnae TaxID=5949 RepID=A0A077ZRU9_STYLE|nr:UNKNOWN [Stylonychia lemnae]|eukprot:CDW72597.1 UNKNOWN [Stylonychia lemnae]
MSVNKYSNSLVPNPTDIVSYRNRKRSIQYNTVQQAKKSLNVETQERANNLIKVRKQQAASQYNRTIDNKSRPITTQDYRQLSQNRRKIQNNNSRSPDNQIKTVKSKEAYSNSNITLEQDSILDYPIKNTKLIQLSNLNKISNFSKLKSRDLTPNLQGIKDLNKTFQSNSNNQTTDLLTNLTRHTTISPAQSPSNSPKKTKLYNKSQISAYTDNENKMNYDKLNRLTQFQSNNVRSYAGSRLNNDDEPSSVYDATNRNRKEQDCLELLQNTQQELKILQYRATNLICGDDLHVQIDKNEKKHFDMIPSTAQYAKIPILGKQPPCKIQIDYPEDFNKKKIDLRICMSRKNKQPNPNNSEKVVTRVNTTSYESVDPYFNQQFLYLGLYTEIGMQFSIKISFPKEDQRDKSVPLKDTQNDMNQTFMSQNESGNSQAISKNKYRMLIQKRIRDLSEDKVQFEEFCEQIEILKRKRNQLQTRGADVNIIAKNKMIVNHWNYIQQELQKSRIDESEDRIQKVQKRKQDIQFEDYKKKLFLLNKWEILKIKRNEMKDEFRDKYQMRTKCMCSTITRTAMKRQEIIEIFRITKKNAVKESQESLEKFQTKRQKAKEILSAFMEETSAVFEMINRFNLMYSRVVKIQKFFRDQKMLDLFRVDFIRSAWDIQREIMQRALLKSGGKQAGIKLKLKKMSLLTDTVREQFVRLYFQKQKIQFIIKFLEMHSDPRDPRIEKYSILLKRLEQKIGITNESREGTQMSLSRQGAKTLQSNNTPSIKLKSTKSTNAQQPSSQKLNSYSVNSVMTENFTNALSIKSSVQNRSGSIKKGSQRPLKQADNPVSLSLFFSFAPKPEQIRTMIEKAIEKQERLIKKSKSTMRQAEQAKPKVINEESHADILASSESLIQQ